MLLRKTIQMATLLCLAVPGISYALGVGNLKTNSLLNEPLDGRIELFSNTSIELETLKAELPDIEIYERFGVEFASQLQHLRFKLIQPEQGTDYIRVYSTKPITEPYLRFLVLFSWSNGQVIREYSLLLDPAIYVPGEATPAILAPGEHLSSASTPRISDSFSAENYGPVVSGETLWSIANRMRPSGVSVNEMMAALFRDNPDAFANENINLLKKGAMLQMPSMESLESLPIKHIQQQIADWLGAPAPKLASESAKTPPAQAPSEVSTKTPKPSAQRADTPPPPSPKPNLSVIAPSEGMGSGSGGNEEGLRENLIIAQESIESLTQENIDLQERLANLEVLAQDLSKLIEFKDDAIASLQNQLGQADIEETTTPAVEETTAPA
ncbi:MAG: type IV pilus assembly protein FimV, partial [Candidatus Eutrophobiaceae bacterium]